MPYKNKTDGVESARRAHHKHYLKVRSDPVALEAERARSMAYKRAHVTSAHRMLCSAKSRAKKAGILFDIDLSDILIPKVCPLLGIPIVEGHLGGKRGATPNSPSLDRVQPDLGYTKGNVWVISHRANVIKQDATADELERVALHLRQKIYDLD